MTTILGDGTVNLDLYPEWEVSRQQQIIKANEETVGGRVNVYKWSDFKRWSMPITFLPNSDTQQINRWWETREQLSLFFDATSYDVMIMNSQSPFGNVNKPYHDQYKGTLIIEVT